jgi:alanine dehydrogenase
MFCEWHSTRFTRFSAPESVPLLRKSPNQHTTTMIKLGIIREGKVPPDLRAPFTPAQCEEIQAQWPVQIVVQPSTIRCFKDEEYQKHGILVQEDISDCDVLLGVKEVPVDQLIPAKTYLFFSHTIKKQLYNRRLLQAVLEKKIRLVDYEVLTDEMGDRLVAFGFYAGVVGAHNGIWTYGQRTGLFSLPRMHESHDYAEIKAAYKQTKWPPMRIVLTGSGRVSSGAVRNLHDMGIHQVSPRDFLTKTYPHPVFTQLFAQDYARHHDKKRIFNKEHFYAHGEEYVSTFAPYFRRTDILINGIFYDQKAPAYFTREEMCNPDFQIQVIADISCDIAPDASIPATLQPSKIADPVYGYNPHTGEIAPPFQSDTVDVMAIDNLPSELPRDASAFFGKQLIDHVLPELLVGPQSAIIHRATIAEKGHLTERYGYLADYVGYELHK